MTIYSVTEERFRKYGKVINNVDFSTLVDEMKRTPIPEGVVYEASVDSLEKLEVAKEIQNV